MRTIIAALVGLMISACAAGASERGDISTPASSPGPDTCPVTVPPQPGFVPPEPYPPELTPAYKAVWYGTPGLWTMVNPNGEVWKELPVGTDGSLGEKTIWWSENYSPGEPAHNTVTGEHLDGSAPTVQVGGPGGGGFNPFLGSFMLVGLELPEPGCWEVTASYQGAELTYVVEVEK